MNTHFARLWGVLLPLKRMMTAPSKSVLSFIGYLKLKAFHLCQFPCLYSSGKAEHVWIALDLMLHVPKSISVLFHDTMCEWWRCGRKCNLYFTWEQTANFETFPSQLHEACTTCLVQEKTWFSSDVNQKLYRESFSFYCQCFSHELALDFIARDCSCKSTVTALCKRLQADCYTICSFQRT